MSRLPTFEDSRGVQDDPKEMFQWAFVAVRLAGDTEFTPNPEAREWLSEHLWDLGFRHDPALMLKKLRTPHRGQQHYLNNTSEWVGIDEPDVAPVALPNMDEYTLHEQALVQEQLYYTGVGKRPEPAEPDKASVVSAPAFDPFDYSVSTVKGYLLGVDEAERRRVLALEMGGKDYGPPGKRKHRKGKKRQGILNDPSLRGL